VAGVVGGFTFCPNRWTLDGFQVGASKEHLLDSALVDRGANSRILRAAECADSTWRVGEHAPVARSGRYIVGGSSHDGSTIASIRGSRSRGNQPSSGPLSDGSFRNAIVLGRIDGTRALETRRRQGRYGEGRSTDRR
jgi:hypothetical protein